MFGKGTPRDILSSRIRFYPKTDQKARMWHTAKEIGVEAGFFQQSVLFFVIRCMCNDIDVLLRLLQGQTISYNAAFPEVTLMLRPVTPDLSGTP